jgi:hypothetical protein
MLGSRLEPSNTYPSRVMVLSTADAIALLPDQITP